MENRKLIGWILLIAGVLVPVMQYWYVRTAVGAAVATPSAEAAFWHTAHSLLLWNAVLGVCSLALMVGGTGLLLTKRRQGMY